MYNISGGAAMWGIIGIICLALIAIPVVIAVVVMISLCLLKVAFWMIDIVSELLNFDFSL